MIDSISQQYQEQQPPSNQSDPECKENEPVLENNKKVITKVEKIIDIKKAQKIKNKLTEFTLTQKVEKYVPYFQIPLSDPVPIEISQLNEEPYQCSLSEQDPTSKYFLYKYEQIGKRILSTYLREHLILRRILDQHDQLLKATSALSEEKKMIHYALRDKNIIVKETDDTPIITNFKEAAFLYYDEEMNIDNFETIIQSATDIHCIEAHILVYLGKKKKQSNDQWKTIKYTQDQHTEAIQQHSQSQQSYPEYLDNTYEEVYQHITKTFSKWDIYSITKMFLDILKETPQGTEKSSQTQELLQNYQETLSVLLSKKTIELTDKIPVIIKESSQLGLSSSNEQPLFTQEPQSIDQPQGQQQLQPFY